MKKKIITMMGLMALFLVGCFSQKSDSKLKIGIDPSFIPLNTMGQESQLYGFCQEFLTEVGHDLKENLELVKYSWDDLLPNLKSNKVDAIMTTLSPYTFYKNEFTFSKPVIKTGPALVSQIKTPYDSLKDMEGKIVGIISGSMAESYISTESSAIIQSFDSPSGLLDALVKGQIDAAMLDYLIAYAYCKDLYSKVLVVSSEPMGESGIRLMMKNTHEGVNRIMDELNRSIMTSDTSKSLKKWQLPQTP